MKKLYIQTLAALIFVGFFQINSFSQASVQSSNGYRVNLNVYPVSIVPSSYTCIWGYNYAVKMNYNISITGSNAPSSLYVLQGTVGCGSANLWFNLPTNGGSGSSNSVTSWSSATDCNTATVVSMNCKMVNIQIGGPGINNQVVSFAVAPALSIKLLSFSADPDKNKVKITWATASETNNDYFSVERSADGIKWKEVATVKGSVNSTSILNYEAFDASPLAGMSYYRLKQTDIDSKISYSNTQQVKYNPANKGISLFPVPNAGNTVNINGISNYSNQELAVVNTNGKTLFTTALSKSSVELPELNPGIYIIRVIDKITGETENIRYVKM